FSNHSTHVAGTIGAAGINVVAHGMANGVQIRSRDFSSDLSEIATDASLIQLSNHSYSFVRGWTTAIDWGIGAVDTWYADRSTDSAEDPDFGKYDGAAQSLDQVLSDNPFLLSVWSAGNDRDDAFTNAHATNQYMTYFST